ncbi:MAG: Rieske 2Fe-2S domain-containing protein [Roseobacter sp.]
MTTRPVGLSRDLAINRAMRAQVDGIDCVVWRNSKGALAAWNNRCPHRGMRLSHGFVRGDRLACLYHGWQYDSAGHCRHMPAHPDLDPPETIKAEVYSVAEVNGVLWVSTSGPAEAQTDTSCHIPLRSLTIAAAVASIKAKMARQATEKGLIALYNPIAPHETLVTVLASADTSLDQLRAHSRWCDAVRRDILFKTEQAA